MRGGELRHPAEMIAVPVGRDQMIDLGDPGVAGGGHDAACIPRIARPCPARYQNRPGATRRTARRTASRCHPRHPRHRYPGSSSSVPVRSKSARSPAREGPPREDTTRESWQCSLFVPVVVQRPLSAAKTGCPRPLMAAAWTASPRRKRVPYRAARLEVRLGRTEPVAGPLARR